MSDGVSFLRFDLDASIGVSDLRSEAVVEASLREHARLRVQRRGEAVGVLVAPDAWRKLTAYVEQLEHKVADLEERYETQAISAIIAERTSGGAPKRLTSEDLAEIDRRIEDRASAAR